jgi:hypothetical protein
VDPDPDLEEEITVHFNFGKKVMKMPSSNFYFVHEKKKP